jgi:lysozyme
MSKEFDDLNKEMAELTALQQGLGSKAEDQEKGVKAFTEATAVGIGQLSKGLGSWTKSVGEGETNFSSLNAVIDIATNALANMAKAIPIVGAGLSQTAKAAGEAGKFMLGQLDSTTKAFNQMGQVAATGAKGMSGLQTQFTTARLPLETFTKMVGENAATFARWKDTTAEGTDAFSEIVGDLTDKGDMTLRRLGMSAEQIGQTASAFITQQTRLGQAQRMTNAELVASTKAYTMDLDQLQKLTGQSAGSIQAQQDKMLSQARFRANIDELVSDGRGDQARAIQNLQTEFSGFNEEMGQGVADLVSGTSEMGTAGGKLMNATGGAALDIMNRMKDNKLSQAEASIELKQAMKSQQERQRQLGGQIDAASAGSLEYSAVSDAVSSLDTDAAKRAKTTQKKQLDKSDGLTESTITAQQQMENMNMELQKLGFQALPYAADAVDAVAVTIDKAVEFIMDRLQGGKPGVESTTTTGMDMGGAEIMTAGEAQLTPAEQKKSSAASASATPAPAAKTAAKPAPQKTTSAPTSSPAASAPTSAPAESAQTSADREKSKYVESAKAGAATVGGAMISGFDAIKQMIMQHEGVRTKPYKDSLGLWTVGVGHLIGDGKTLPDSMNREFSQQEIMAMFDQDFAKHVSIAQRTPGWDKANDIAKGAMVDLAFNMGQWWDKFPNTAKALAAGDWKSAADGLRDSNWFKQVKGRAVTVTGMIEQGGNDTGKKASAANGAILSGPQQGYNPNTSMAGVDVKPLNKQAMDAANLANGQASIDPQMFGLQMEQLDLLIASAKNQLAVKQRILKAKA